MTTYWVLGWPHSNEKFCVPPEQACSDDQADIVLATDHALAVLWMEKIEQELAGGCAARRSLDSR